MVFSPNLDMNISFVDVKGHAKLKMQLYYYLHKYIYNYKNNLTIFVGLGKQVSRSIWVELHVLLL